MAEKTDSQTPTDRPTGLPASAGSGGVYRLMNDEGERWISKPDNGGDLGDMQDITAELNRLLDLLQRTHYRLIGKHGWGDLEATLIGDAMGWDSGSQNAELQRPREAGSVARSGSPAKREARPQQPEVPQSPAERGIDPSSATGSAGPAPQAGEARAPRLFAAARGSANCKRRIRNEAEREAGAEQDSQQH